MQLVWLISILSLFLPYAAPPFLPGTKSSETLWFILLADYLLFSPFYTPNHISRSPCSTLVTKTILLKYSFPAHSFFFLQQISHMTFLLHTTVDAIIPACKGYFIYIGSLTQPYHVMPCTPMHQVVSHPNAGGWSKKKHWNQVNMAIPFSITNILLGSPLVKIIHVLLLLSLYHRLSVTQGQLDTIHPT